MLCSTTLRWNSVHVATVPSATSVSWIGTWYMRSCSIQAQLYRLHLRRAWSKNQRAVLPRRVADATATSDLQHCWRRVSLPARQCASTLCLWHSRASAPWEAPIHQSWRVASQLSWLQPGRLPHVGYVAQAHVSSTNLRYGRVADSSCCDMGWNSAQRDGRCSWSVAKKTGSMYPCRRWSFWTLALTLLAWQSSCHTSQPALVRATSVWGNATDEQVLHFTR